MIPILIDSREPHSPCETYNDCIGSIIHLRTVQYTTTLEKLFPFVKHSSFNFVRYLIENGKINSRGLLELLYQVLKKVALPKDKGFPLNYYVFNLASQS